MNPKQQLDLILSKIAEDQANVPALKRAIKSVSKTYKQTNSKYIEQIIFIAASVRLFGDASLALELLEFIEDNAIEGKYVHLDSALSMARQLRIDIHLENGSVQSADEIKNKFDLSHTSELKHYTNPVFEVIEESDLGLEFEEQDEENPHSYLLNYAFQIYMQAIELICRIDELKDRINDGDQKYLELAKNRFKEKFKFYLSEVSTQAELNRHRKS